MFKCIKFKFEAPELCLALNSTHLFNIIACNVNAGPLKMTQNQKSVLRDTKQNRM